MTIRGKCPRCLVRNLILKNREWYSFYYCPGCEYSEE